MEPRDLSQYDIERLPDHDLVMIMKNHPTYRSLSVARLTGRNGLVISRWTFTDLERRAIAEGEDVYLEVCTFGLPLQPMLPSVGLREIVIDDGD